LVRHATKSGPGHTAWVAHPAGWFAGNMVTREDASQRKAGVLQNTIDEQPILHVQDEHSWTVGAWRTAEASLTAGVYMQTDRRQQHTFVSNITHLQSWQCRMAGVVQLHEVWPQRLKGHHTAADSELLCNKY
jgi:hypothetical protein